MRTCTVEGCERPHLARGYCELHYRRWHRSGDPLVVGQRGTANARKTHCRYGHPYDLGNTHWTRRGQRMCLTCMRAQNHARKRGLTLAAYMREQCPA